MTVAEASWIVRWRIALAVCALGVLSVLVGPTQGREGEEQPPKKEREKGDARSEVEKLEALLAKQKADIDETARQLRVALDKEKKAQAEKDKDKAPRAAGKEDLEKRLDAVIQELQQIRREMKGAAPPAPPGDRPRGFGGFGPGGRFGPGGGGFGPGGRFGPGDRGPGPGPGRETEK